jgi:hypothetical protein
MSETAWEPLGRVSADALCDARLRLHHAAQIVSAVGITHLPHAADDSHTNMEWTRGALSGHVVPGARPFRAAIFPVSLSIALLDEGGNTAEELSLFDRTLDDGYAWMEGAISRWTGTRIRPVRRPEYSLPEHSAARGEPFRADSAPGLEEIARWYGNAGRLLSAMMPAFPSSSPVRCWPHHFDIAMLLPEGDSKSVGAGLSPGDETYPQPYWYVSPYPYPKDPSLGALPSRGKWHQGSFFAAVLTGCDLVAGGPEAEQEARSRSFLQAAISECLGMLRV